MIECGISFFLFFRGCHCPTQDLRGNRAGWQTHSYDVESMWAVLVPIKVRRQQLRPIHFMLWIESTICSTLRKQKNTAIDVKMSNHDLNRSGVHPINNPHMNRANTSVWRSSMTRCRNEKNVEREMWNDSDLKCIFEHGALAAAVVAAAAYIHAYLKNDWRPIWFFR